MPEHNDVLLWQKILDGDEAAFSTLYLSYRPLLLHYGLKLGRDRALTEDCLQELFCQLYLYKNDRRTIKNIKTYLFVSFRRELFRMLKKRRKNDSLSHGGAALEPHITFTQEDFLIEEERLAEREDVLHHLLNKLSPRQREIIYLRYYKGLDNEEIADVLEITYQVVHNTIYKAFKRLRKMGLTKKSSINF